MLKDAQNNIVKVSDEGVRAVTKISRLSSNGSYSLVRIELLTGRTHQARVHTAHVKHPIIGDRKYGDFNVNKSAHVSRPLLHAYELGFPDDLDGDLAEISGKTFIAPIPDDIKHFIDTQGISL